MSEGLYIPIEVQEDAVKRAEAQIKNLETALNRVSADKLNQQLGQISTTIEKSKKHISDTYPQLEKQLKQLETQATSTAAKYAAAFGHLGPQIDGVVREMRTMNSTVKELHKNLDLNFKSSEQYRISLQSQTEILRGNSAQQTANAEAVKRSVETANRLRAELQQLHTAEGRNVAVLRERLAAEQSLQKAQAEAATITTRQATQAQQLANRQAELNTEVGRNNLIVKEQIKGQERQITFAARQANAANELAQRLKYLNTEEGRNSVVLKEQIKQKEMLAGLDTKRRNELTNLRREVKHLSTEEGKQAQILKERVKYKSQVAALEERHTNALKLLRKESAYLNSEEAKTAARYRENIKYKSEALAADTRRKNSLKLLTAELKYVQSAEGRKAAQLRESIKFETAMSTAETKRLNTLATLRADLRALNSETGRKIAQTQQEVAAQKAIDAAEAKRVATIRQLTEAQSTSAQGQQRDIELLRRQNELVRKSAELAAKAATQTQALTNRKRELQLQIAALNTPQGREIIALERKLQQTRKNIQTTSTYVGTLGRLHTAYLRLIPRINLAAQATSGFRASIMGAGASFGIFTSSTILVATAVYSTARAFRESISAGAEFESTMDRVSAVMDVTGNSSQMLENRVRSLAAVTVFTGTEVSQGMLYLGMAGMQTADAMTAIEPSLRLASIGMMDMGTTADIVTNILYGFNLGSEQLTHVVDNMAYAITSSNMDIQQLGNAMSYVAPLAREADISLQEVVASLQSLHNAGIKASRAGTGMRTTMLALLAPTEKAQSVLDKYNISIDDHTGRMRNWTTLLEEFAEAKLTMGEVENLVGKRQAAAFKIMIDAAKHTDEYKNKLQELGVEGVKTASELRYLTESLHQNSGAARAMQDMLEDNLRGDYLKMISAFQDKLLEFYDQNREYYRDLVQGVTEWIRSFDVSKVQGFFEYVINNLKTAVQLLGAWKAAKLGMKLGAGAGALAGSTVLPGLGTVGGSIIGGTAGFISGGVGGYHAAGAAVDYLTPDIQEGINQQMVSALVGDQDIVEHEARNIIRKYSQSSLEELVGYHKDIQSAMSNSERLMLQTKLALEEAYRIDAEGSTAAARQEAKQLEALLESIQANIDDMEKRARGIEIVVRDVAGGITVAESEATINYLQTAVSANQSQVENLKREGQRIVKAVANEFGITDINAQSALTGEWFPGDPTQLTEYRDQYIGVMEVLESVELSYLQRQERLAKVQATHTELVQADIATERERQEALQGQLDIHENRVTALQRETEEELASQQVRLTGEAKLASLREQQAADIKRLNELSDLSVLIEQRKAAETEGNAEALKRANDQLDEMGFAAETANASYREAQRLKSGILDRDTEIHQLASQITQENERQAQASARAYEQAKRRTVQEARVLAQSEKAYQQAQKELRAVVEYNGNIEHRNKMLNQGYLLLDDQDYQLVQMIRNQEEMVDLLRSEIIARYESGELTDEALQVELDRLQVERDKIPALQRQREEILKGVDAQSAAHKMAELHLNAIEQMYSTIESSTVRLMESGFRDTKNFFDSIVAQFKRMLAELAYQAAVKPIIVNMVASMGGAVFGQATAQRFAASQGVGLGGTDGSAMSLGQMASSAWNFMSGGGQSASLAAMGGSIAKSGFGQAVGLSNVVPGTGGYVMNTAAGDFLQSGMGYSPWGIVGSLGANMLGFQGSGNMVVDTVMQTGGAIAGGAMGAKLGSLGGPIGAIAGAALGTVFSSLFGGDKGYRERGGLSTSSGESSLWATGKPEDDLIRGQSAFGNTEVFVNKYGDPKKFQGYLDALIQLDNVLAASNPDKVKEVAAALDGFKMGGARGDQGKIAGDFTTARMEIVYKAIDEVMYDLSHVLLEGLEKIDPMEMGNSFIGLQQLQKEFEITEDVVINLRDTILTQFQQIDEGIGFTLNRVATNFTVVQQSLELFGHGLEGTIETLLQLSTNLIDYAGGIEDFATAAGKYYEVFYSEEEKFAGFMRSFNEELNSLGITLPETAGAFRATVDALLQDANDLHGAYDMMSISEEAAKYYQQLESWIQGLGESYMQYLGRLPTDTELGYWIDALKSGSMTFSQALEKMTASIRGAQVTLSNDEVIQLQESAAAIYDAYNYSLEVIKEEHDLRLQRIRAEHNLYDTVRKLIDNLKLSNVSPLTPAERLAEAQQQYQTVMQEVQSGDLSRAGELQGMSQTYLQEASQFYASSDDYIAIFNSVLFQLEDLEAQYGQTLTVEERIEQANLDLIQLQESAKTVLQDQLSELAQQTHIDLTLLQLMQFLPADLAQALNAVLPWDQILAERSGGQMDWGINSGIVDAYQGLLGRDPDFDGGQYWQNNHDAGMSIEDIHASFKNSPEYQIKELYRTLLNREADSDGLNYHLNHYNSGMTLAQIAESFRASQEYKNLNGTHRSGLDYVPFDGYVAELHKGEQVVPSNARRSNDATESLVVEVKALRAEVAKLRSDQRENTQAVVRSNYDANNQAAAAVGKSVERAAESSRTIHDKVTLR